MRKCFACKEEKPLEEFARDSKRANGRTYKCKSCTNEYSRERYNNQNHVRVRDAINKRAQSKVRIVNTIKMHRPCIDCGNIYPPIAMDFDHCRGEKLFNISNSAKHNLSELLDEIEKCDLVCATCHRIRTWKRMTNNE